MQKPLLFLFAIIATVLTVVSISQRPKTGISSGESTIVSTNGTTPTATLVQVPLTTGSDVIRTFIELLNEGKIPEAISMMDGSLITSDSDKQQYGVVFNSFSSITLNKITLEEFGRDDWGPDEERYRVELTISLKPDSQKSLWDNGQNTRWITVKKQEGRFMIHDIATGP